VTGGPARSGIGPRRPGPAPAAPPAICRTSSTAAWETGSGLREPLVDATTDSDSIITVMASRANLQDRPMGLTERSMALILLDFAVRGR
jgi:hypothetical protein